MPTTDDYLAPQHPFGPEPGQPRAGNPHFYEILDACAALHERKNLDYAGDPYSQQAHGLDNFFRAAEYAGCTPRQVFKVMQGIKLARIRALERTPEHIPPNFESIADSKLDLLNYIALEMACARTYPDEIDRLQDFAITP